MSKAPSSKTQVRLTDEQKARAKKMAQQKADRLAGEAKQKAEREANEAKATPTILNSTPSASLLCTNRCASSRRMRKRRPASSLRNRRKSVRPWNRRSVEARELCKATGENLRHSQEGPAPNYKRTRLYQILAIADGRKTPESIREEEREKKRKQRAGKSVRDKPDVPDDAAPEGEKPKSGALDRPGGSWGTQKSTFPLLRALDFCGGGVEIDPGIIKRAVQCRTWVGTNSSPSSRRNSSSNFRMSRTSPSIRCRRMRSCLDV